MVDVKAALTRKIGPLPVIAWGAILGGGIIVAKAIGIGGGAGSAPSGGGTVIGSGAVPLPDAFDGGSGGGLTPTTPVDIPGTGDGTDTGANAFFDWLLHAPGTIVTPPAGDEPGTITLPDPTPTTPGGSIITPPASWWDAIPELPTIVPAPVPIPSQPPVTVPGTVTPPTTIIKRLWPFGSDITDTRITTVYNPDKVAEALRRLGWTNIGTTINYSDLEGASRRAGLNYGTSIQAVDIDRLLTKAGIAPATAKLPPAPAPAPTP